MKKIDNDCIGEKVTREKHEGEQDEKKIRKEKEKGLFTVPFIDSAHTLQPTHFFKTKIKKEIAL